MDPVSKVDKWIHLATTYDYPTGIQRHYLDGELLAGCDHGKSVDVAMDGDLYLGTCGPDCDIQNENGLDGSLACVQMYDVALSRSQLLESIRLCGPKGMCIVNPSRAE